jgi:predicted nucleic acid-binding protein
MMLIDTSAWIEFLRKKGNPAVKQRVAELMSADEAAFTCPVLFELMAGARDEAEAGLVRQATGFCRRVGFEPQDWDHASGIERTLRRGGAMVPRDDILVASVAVRVKMPVLCCDAHFEVIREKAAGALRVEVIRG